MYSACDGMYLGNKILCLIGLLNLLDNTAMSIKSMQIQKSATHKMNCKIKPLVKQNSMDIWWFMTNLPKFYLPKITILADLLCKAANLPVFFHQNVLIKFINQNTHGVKKVVAKN